MYTPFSITRSVDYGDTLRRRDGIAIVLWCRSGPVILVLVHVFFQGNLREVLIITIITLIFTFTAIVFLNSLICRQSSSPQAQEYSTYIIYLLRKISGVTRLSPSTST